MKNRSRILRLCGALALLGVLLGVPGAGRAQGASRTFPETGKTVSGLFLTYWNSQGALAQQGYPISDEMQEVSDLNGQTYTVQYFERAVFEKHPENGPPFDVLLSQLGTFRYKAKYGAAGAPNQQVSTANPRVFPVTGHTLGGKFRVYWESHGGLAQQGYPISDEFSEVSDLNSQPYTVQYFERAVFELHPENQPPYDVLLSQLGTFQYRAKYLQPSPTPPPAATATPLPSDPCGSDIPAATDAAIDPRCGALGTQFHIRGTGFTAGEAISYALVGPGGNKVIIFPADAGAADAAGAFAATFDSSQLKDIQGTQQGVWAITYRGGISGHQSTAYFKITSGGGPSGAGCDGIPASQNQTVTPNCGPAGTRFRFSAGGFKPGEMVGIYATMPDGQVFGAPFQAPADANGRVEGISFSSSPHDEPGIWANSMEGTQSHAKAIGYFKVLTPAP